MIQVLVFVLHTTWKVIWANTQVINNEKKIILAFFIENNQYLTIKDNNVESVTALF